MTQLIKIISSDFHNIRLDQAATALFEDYSRSQIQRWIEAGNLLINGESLRPKDKVQEGDELSLDPILENRVSWEAEDIPLNIHHEEDEFLIINKPYGLVMHPGAGCNNGTLANALAFHYPQLIQLPRCGIVHRLDKDTSGVFIMAKKRESAQLLTSLFRLRKVHKTYLAICHGELNKNSGEWNDDLIRYDGEKKIIEKAKTLYKVLDKNSEASLVELKPITGRKHQLRKQLYAVGQPIFGDVKYKLSNSFKGINKNLMLHSYQIRFIANDIKHTYTALLPDYFRKLLKTKRLRFLDLK